MSISSELLTLQNTKTAIRTAINNKGGSVGASDTFASYATAIDNLPSGGDDSTLRDLIERDITSITIPSGTTKIGQYAFYSLYSLTSVSIPGSVRRIESHAFRNCSALASINIPNGVTAIGDNTFNECSSLTSINIPNGVTVIADNTFNGCSSLTSVSIGNGVTDIGLNAFRRCTSLASINIPNGVTSIAGGAFFNCTSLTDVNIPDSVTNIGNDAFNGCSSLASVTVNATIPPTLGIRVFENTNNCPIYVPAESLATFKAANNWSSYESRIYPIAQVATVDGNPVYNYEIGNKDSKTIMSTEMDKLPTGTSIEFAEGLTNIAAGEINYQQVTLPSTFTGFGDSDMIGSSVTTITSNAVTPPSAFKNRLGGSGLTAVYVSASAVDTYKAHAAWSGFASIIQAIPSE